MSEHAYNSLIIGIELHMPEVFVEESIAHQPMDTVNCSYDRCMRANVHMTDPVV